MNDATNNLPNTARPGATIKLAYKGYRKDGSLFDEATPQNPLEFTLGTGVVPEGIEDSVIGMTPGETKQAAIPPEKGFGNYSSDQLIRLPRHQLPSNETIGVGDRLQVTGVMKSGW